jgi:hypothetical protein
MLKLYTVVVSCPYSRPKKKEEEKEKYRGEWRVQTLPNILLTKLFLLFLETGVTIVIRYNTSCNSVRGFDHCDVGPNVPAST